MRCNSSAPKSANIGFIFKNDRKFGLFAHCITFQIGPDLPLRAVSKIPMPSLSVS